MSLLRLLETIQNLKTLAPHHYELLESVELHLINLVDILGIYVECSQQPDEQVLRFLNELKEKLYGSIEETEGRTPGVSKHANHNGTR